MALLDQVRQVCQRLASSGWRDILQVHGCNLEAADLEQELLKPLTNIQRSQPGFQDFHPDGNRAIEPGHLARSLLYHALASPAVHPQPDGRNATPQDYPTLAELDIIENYIYAKAQKRLSDFNNPVIAVFAYQYRHGNRSHHGVHGDMAFSRTGVARVGTTAPHYDRIRRSFWIEPEDGSQGIGAMPARYGVFIAERVQFSNNGDFSAIQRPIEGAGVTTEFEGITVDPNLAEPLYTFLIPKHKLFASETDECLVGETLPSDAFHFIEFHLNEKLQRVHTAAADNPGAIPNTGGFDVNRYPFIRTSNDEDALIKLETVGSSLLVVPLHHDTLVRLAEQTQGLLKRTVFFNVPPKQSVPGTNRENRFPDFASLEIPAGEFGRAAPEYVNIRAEVINTTTGMAGITNLNELDELAYRQKLLEGNYRAAHFIDDTGEGSVRCQVTGLSRTLEDFPAYSLVSAVDFLPLADQMTLKRWQERNPAKSRRIFATQDPRPLSYGRYMVTVENNQVFLTRRSPNPDLPLPEGTTKAFPVAIPESVTVTAIVGETPADQSSQRFEFPHTATSFLPDGASDVFAPGWDVSRHGNEEQQWYAGYGLGSPFPEDAKLCAALSSFWPAASPDTARTFPDLGVPTAIPQLDAELGYHPDHPKVKAGLVEAQLGWDGEYGPFFENDHQFVNFMPIERSDYTWNTLQSKFDIAKLAQVDGEELIARLEALGDCLGIIEPDRTVSQTSLILVEAEKISDWPAAGIDELAGGGYLYGFAEVERSFQAIPDSKRGRFPVIRWFTCQVAAQRIRWRVSTADDQGRFQVQARS